jgi:hypothetical protein
MKDDPLVVSFVESLLARKDTQATIAVFHDYLVENYPDQVDQINQLQTWLTMTHNRLEFPIEDWLANHMDAVVLGVVDEDSLYIEDRLTYRGYWWSFTADDIEDDDSEVPLEVLQFLPNWRLETFYAGDDSAQIRASSGTETSIPSPQDALAHACWHWAVDRTKRFLLGEKLEPCRLQPPIKPKETE